MRLRSLVPRHRGEVAGWTLDWALTLASVCVGWTYESYRWEATLTIHLGPLHIVWWRHRGG